MRIGLAVKGVVLVVVWPVTGLAGGALIPKISLGCGILAARFFPTFSLCSTKMIVAFSPRRANTINTCAYDTEA